MLQLREEHHPGWTVVDPVEVLFEQACAQWELFTGSRAPRKAMWQACLSEYAHKMKINAYSSMYGSA
jgi:shikimate 5-dehydrogenase